MMTAYLPHRPAPRALPSRVPSRRLPALTVQHLGIEPSVLDSLPSVLDEVGRELGVELKIDGAGGDVVLAAPAFLAGVAPQILNALLEGRPLLTLDAAVQTPHELHAGLMRQLRGLAQCRRAASPAVHGDAAMPQAARGDAAAFPVAGGDAAAFPVAGGDTAFRMQFRLEPDRSQLLKLLRRCLQAPGSAPVTAAYGREAVLRFDFDARTVLIDPLAEQRLRAKQELPCLANGMAPGAHARSRALDRTVWDIGFAAGSFHLLEAPPDWWNAPLTIQLHYDVERYTLRPSHLELARWLGQAPVTPAELHRHGRMDLADLRSFLQAGLFVGLLRWLPAARRK